jgi:putative DNA primase/helicase
VLAADEVLIAEGEKDADRLRALGFTATTNFEGASKNTQKPKWREEYSATLAGKNLVFIPDNDAVGRAHMENAARSCHTAGAASVRIAQLPGLPEKGDVSDWLDAGHTADELRELIAAAPEWVPPAQEEPAEAANIHKARGDALFDLSHDGLALALGGEWASAGRYVALWGKWLFWDGANTTMSLVRLSH